MKFTASLTVLLISSVLSFQPAPITRHGTALCMGLFDFKPFHGAGSGSKNSEIEEQYRLQQELLAARRDHINFDSLHEKYSHEDEKHEHDVFSLGEQYVEDKFVESFVDEKQKKKKKNFWDLKP